MTFGGLTTLVVAAGILAGPAPASLATTPLKLAEVPEFTEVVGAGELPSVDYRVPEQPWIVRLPESDKDLGAHGGNLRLLMGKARELRMMMVYGYARLVCYNDKLELVPDILERLEVEDSRVFTFHLRKGHKWSDGHPFTSEDFRYYWQDVANNEDLSPFGPPKRLLPDGEPPRVDIIDELTVRYSWPQPNPYFLPALAAASPLFIYRPAHYLKQFHARYANAAELATMVKQAGARNWAGLHHRKDHQYKFDNPELPTLQPWLNTTKPPSERFVFKRNPYYHRVDAAGRQLPYIDRVTINIADSKLIPAKTGAGDSDLQGRYLRLDNYTFLKEAEKRNDYRVRLWRTAKGAQIALFPNLNANDPVWRDLLRDVRFRRALSLAVNRHEINQVVYYGLVLEGNNTVLPQSPLFKREYQTAWASFQPKRANALLDEIGLTERDDRGIRLMRDGRPLEVIVQTAGESTEETDVLELIHDSWSRVGVKLYSKPSQREVFRNRIFSGDAIMSIWSGLSNALPTANMSPAELAPTSQQQLQWPKWGQYYETNQQAGLEPDMASVIELVRLNKAWRHATSVAKREQIWHRMLKIHSEQVFSIGVVAGVPQPVVINNELHNVPIEGIYSWHPSSYFGIYKPDTFWFSGARRQDE